MDPSPIRQAQGRLFTQDDIEGIQDDKGAYWTQKFPVLEWHHDLKISDASQLIAFSSHREITYPDGVTLSAPPLLWPYQPPEGIYHGKSTRSVSQLMRLGRAAAALDFQFISEVPRPGRYSLVRKNRKKRGWFLTTLF